ncbi:MAG: Hsp20/alpha crystallin family protein [Candidatus Krumholzibacteriia bacterium]
MAENTVTRGNLPVHDEGEQRPATRQRSLFLTPAVDIYESKDGLVVVADVPGLKREDLDITVEENVLTIHGRMSREEPEPLQAREYTLHDYFRQFTLGDRVDRDKIHATLEHGVLTLKLPHAEHAKPKRIAVK